MKTVVIGVGRMGCRHIQAISNFDLVGICDQHDDSLTLAAKEYNIPEECLFRDASKMLRETRPQLCIISTTAPSHCKYTCMAAEMEVKYILCEKPMAISLSECDLMIETCRQNGSLLAINHQMRYMDHYQKSKEIINSLPFGGLCSVNVFGGNFGMAMNGLHYFEMFRFMTDEEPKEIIAWFSNAKVPNPRGEQFEDKAGSIRLTTESGKRFYMEIGDDQGHGLVSTFLGPYGHIIVNELTGKLNLSIREEQYRPLPTTRYAMPAINETIEIPPTSVVDPTQSLIKDLLSEKGYPTGEQGRLAVSVLVSGYVSSEMGGKPILLGDKKIIRDRAFPWA